MRRVKCVQYGWFVFVCVRVCVCYEQMRTRSETLNTQLVWFDLERKQPAAAAAVPDAFVFVFVEQNRTIGQLRRAIHGDSITKIVCVLVGYFEASERENASLHICIGAFCLFACL